MSGYREFQMMQQVAKTFISLDKAVLINTAPRIFNSDFMFQYTK